MIQQTIGISFFLLLTRSSPLTKDKVCTGGGVPCKIPFTFNGNIHFECITGGPDGGGDLFGRCPISDTEWAKCDRSCPLQRYTENREINNHFSNLVDQFPNLAKIVTVGRSSLDQEILGIRISRGVREEREMLKPMFRYSGNMHGNEPVGREMLNHLAEVLLRGYGLDETITQMVDTTDITIIPTINPDGFDRGTEGACSGADYKTGRYNEGNRDLNRDFPTWRDVNLTREALYEGRQPETRAMMDLILDHPWVLSANFHDGAVVASYPYDDYRPGKKQNGIHETPDHAFFRSLASTYATNHQTMLDQSVCTRWYFEDGITNGADWYALYGGMQDFNYIFTNDFEVTMELSCCKYPKSYYLNKEWERNKASLLEYMKQVHRGAKGLVYTTLEGAGASDGEADNIDISVEGARPLAGAVVVVTDISGVPIEKNVTSSSRGEFWRLLLPGDYLLSGYKDMCNTAGVILASKPSPLTVSPGQPLVRQDLVLNSVLPCNSGPR